MYLLCINKPACSFQPEMAIFYVHHQAEFSIVIIKDGLTHESEEKRHMFNFQGRKRKGAPISSDQLPCLQHELWLLLYIWEVFEPPFHFSFFTIVIWPVWFHFAALGHLLFKIMFTFILPRKNSFKSNSVHVSVHCAEPGIGWIFIYWWYRYKNLPVFSQVRDSTETSHWNCPLKNVRYYMQCVCILNLQSLRLILNLAVNTLVAGEQSGFIHVLQWSGVEILRGFV